MTIPTDFPELNTTEALPDKDKFITQPIVKLNLYDESHTAQEMRAYGYWPCKHYRTCTPCLPRSLRYPRKYLKHWWRSRIKGLKGLPPQT